MFDETPLAEALFGHSLLSNEPFEDEEIFNNLSTAALADDMPEVQRQLKAGADINAAHPFSPSHPGAPALICAFRARNFPIMVYLLEQGADPNVCDANGITPLMLAANTNEVHFALQLYKHGANLHATTPAGETAMHYAAREECEEAILFMLSEKGGGKLITQTNAEGLTPFTLAITHGRWENLKLFLPRLTREEIQTEIERCSVDNCSTLHLAVQGGSQDIIDWLLSMGQRPTKADRLGNTPLHNAVRRGSARTVRALIKAGADLNHRNNQLKTPLHMAVGNLHAHIVKELLNAGADVHLRDSKEFTALHIAAGLINPDSLKHLISKGADVNAVARYNITPLAVAVFKGNRDSVKLLLKAGADSTGYLWDKFSMQEIAASYGQKAIANLIKKDNLSRGFRPVMSGMNIEQISEYINNHS